MKAFLFPGPLLYAVGDACQSQSAVNPVPGAPHLSISAQPTAASILKEQAGAGTWQPLTSFPTASLGRPHQLLRFLLSVVFLCLSTGWRSWLAYKPACTENKIKTTITERSNHGTEREGRKQEEIFECQGQQQEEVLVVKNVLSVVCHLSRCFARRRAAVQLPLAQKFNEEAGASCRTTWCLIVDAGRSAVQTLESPGLELLLVGLELEGWEWGLTLHSVRQGQC